MKRIDMFAELHEPRGGWRDQDDLDMAFRRFEASRDRRPEDDIVDRLETAETALSRVLSYFNQHGKPEDGETIKNVSAGLQLIRIAIECEAEHWPRQP